MRAVHNRTQGHAQDRISTGDNDGFQRFQQKRSKDCFMAAYAEGMNILRHANVGTHALTVDTEKTSLRNPGHCPSDFNLTDAAVWPRGSDRLIPWSIALDISVQGTTYDPF
jgi:hypothetical protein